MPNLSVQNPKYFQRKMAKYLLDRHGNTSTDLSSKYVLEYILSLLVFWNILFGLSISI